MKKLFVCVCIVATGLLIGSTEATAQWSTYRAEAFNIQIDVPDAWNTTVEGDLLESTSDDGSIVLLLYPYKDESISTEELFYMVVEELGFESEGDVQEIEDLNGLHAYLGVGVGDVDGDPVGIVLISATYDENNYIGYIFTNIDAYEGHADTMINIISSLAPLQ
jgi:hypothetical protein